MSPPRGLPCALEVGAAPRCGKPGAFRADTSLLQGVTPPGASPEGLFGTLGRTGSLFIPSSAPGLELAQKPGRKRHGPADNLQTRGSGVASLQGGEPAARGSGVVPRPSPWQGRLPSRAHGQLPLEKGTAAGRGPRPSCSPCQPRHTQRRAPGGTTAPFSSARVRGCHLRGQGYSPQGCKAAAKLHTQQRATLACRHCQPVPGILFVLPSPGTGRLGQAASCPAASVSPAGRDGGAQAGGGLPWGDASLGVVAPCDTQCELAVTQRRGGFRGKGPPVWGRDFAWGQAWPEGSTDHLARWHELCSAPHTWWAGNNTKKGQSGHPDGTWGCVGTASPTCKDEECRWCPLCFPFCCQDRYFGHPVPPPCHRPHSSCHCPLL